MTLAELRTAIDQQAALMVAVATGGPQIEGVQEQYIERRREIRRELQARTLEDPNPFADLWAWYGYYSQNLPRWYERRTYVRELYEPLHEALDAMAERDVGAGLDKGERTGWERVDDQVVQLRLRYSEALTVEDFQAVGLLCRDIFVSLAEATFEPGRHASDGEEAPGKLLDQLNAVIEREASGAANKELRGLLKASIAYANKVQHDRTASREHARIVAEATVAAVNLLRALLVSGQEAELEAIRQAWSPTILPALGERSIPLASILATARPVELNGDLLTIQFPPRDAFNRLVAAEPKNAAMLREMLYEITERRLAIEFRLGESER